MRRTVIILAAAVALVLAGQASAGCWATAGISPLPTGVTVGETWNVDVRVLQHGRTPLAGATPTVVIAGGANGTERSFQASPTAEPGHYRAAVTFPARGDWSVAVHDGFPEAQCAQTHTFGTHVIAAATAPSGPAPPDAAPVPGGPSPWPIVGGVLGALALLAVALAVRHSRPRTAAEA
jgi:hypothetical protein